MKERKEAKKIGKKTKIFIAIVLYISLAAGSMFLVIKYTEPPKATITVKEADYVLKGAKYIGSSEPICSTLSCKAILKFEYQDNVYSFKGKDYEIDTMVVNSIYDVYYDNENKEIENYNIP